MTGGFGSIWMSLIVRSGKGVFGVGVGVFGVGVGVCFGGPGGRSQPAIVIKTKKNQKTPNNKFFVRILSFIVLPPNSMSSPENKLLPYPVLPIFRKAVLHTDRSPAARAASSERCLEKRYTLFHVRPHRSLDSTELPELPQARLILPQSCSQVPRLHRPHNHKLQ